MKRSKCLSFCLFVASISVTSCGYDTDDYACNAICSSDQYCSNDTCISKAGYNEACHNDDMCMSGTCLHNTCTCSPEAPCGEGKFCDYKQNIGFCTERFNVGASCTSDDMCKSNICQNDVCADRQIGGLACTMDAMCLSGTCLNGACSCNDAISCSGATYCDNGRCIPKLSAGKACTNDDQCMTGVCDSDNKCSAYSLGGLQCTSDDMCLSKKCSYGVCECNISVACTNDTFCNLETNACVKKLEIGEHCNGMHTNCKSGFCGGNASIEAQVCVDAYPGGKACVENYMCKTGECVSSVCSCNNNVPCLDDTDYCDLQINSCIPKHKSDEECTADEMCLSHSCNIETQKCRATNVGSPCTQNNECSSRFCNNNTCACISNDDCETGSYCSNYTCVPKHLGAESCKSNEECLSGYCDISTGMCDCNSLTNIACAKATKCAPDNKCYPTLQTYAKCTENSECLSNLCIQGICMECSNNAPCANGFACDGGFCREIVNCPNSADKCIVSANIIPNISWSNANITSAALKDPREYLSPHFNINLPKDNVFFCITPIYKSTFINILSPLIQTMESTLSVNEKNANLMKLIPEMAASLSYNVLSDYLKDTPYVWAIFYDITACKDYPTNAIVNDVCRGASDEQSCKCVPDATGKKHPDKLLAFSDALFEAFYQPLVINGDKNSDITKQNAIREIFSNFMDPRIFSRLQSGCMEMTLGKDFNITLDKTSSAELPSSKIYLSIDLANSNLITNEEGFDISIENGNKSNTNIVENLTSGYKSTITFPIDAESVALATSYPIKDHSSLDTDSNSYTFRIKPSYSKRQNATQSYYTPLLCNDFYTMNFPKDASTSRAECQSKYDCSYSSRIKDNQLITPEGDENCPITSFTRVKSIKVYLEAND